MRIESKTSALQKGVTTVAKAVASSGPILALRGILLDADKEAGVLRLRATDLNLTISCTIPATVETGGSVVVPGRYLADVIRNLTGTSASMELEGSSLHIVSGSSRFSLRTLSSEEFPEKAETQGQSVSLDKSAFLKGVRKVSRAAARDESRPTISGVHLELGENGIELAATDSYRLAVFEAGSHKNGSGPDANVKVVLPSRALDEVQRIFGSDETSEFKLVIGDSEASFVSDEVEITTRTIEGTFPDFHRILPAEFEFDVLLDKESILGAVKRASVVQASQLRFKWEAGKVEVTADSQDVGEAREVIDVDYDREPFEIAFNPTYLAEGLQNFEGSSVKMSFLTSAKPGLITSEEDAGYRYLIMPLRV